jgi:hypothetical protein
MADVAKASFDKVSVIVNASPPDLSMPLSKD